MRLFPAGARDREESVRRLVLAALAALVLTGCQSLYDDLAMQDCDETTRAGGERSDCYDRVEQNSRERRD
jgi:hypothetical protein